MEQVSKESVNYRPATGNHKCGNCVMFHQNGTCDLVMGKISPEDTCDRWEAKVQKSEDLEMLSLRLLSMKLEYNNALTKSQIMKNAGDPVNANKLDCRAWELRRDA